MLRFLVSDYQVVSMQFRTSMVLFSATKIRTLFHTGTMLLYRNCTMAAFLYKSIVLSDWSPKKATH